MLPLSHDEVVYGKGSLIGKMPGDDWQQFANLRALFGYMWGHPGKKLLFMGGEFGQRREWTHEGELEWWVPQLPEHAGVQRWVRDLNRVYRSEPALHQHRFRAGRLRMDRRRQRRHSVIAFLRKGARRRAPVLVACNFTPVPRHNYLLGVPRAACWREILNSDARDYGGARLGQSRRRRIGAGAAPTAASSRSTSPCRRCRRIMLRWEGHG